MSFKQFSTAQDAPAKASVGQSNKPAAEAKPVGPAKPETAADPAKK